MNDHEPCCTAHGIPMDCERYRRTHFVEVRPCCSKDAERLRSLKQALSTEQWLNRVSRDE